MAFSHWIKYFGFVFIQFVCSVITAVLWSKASSKAILFCFTMRCLLSIDANTFAAGNVVSYAIYATFESCIPVICGIAEDDGMIIAEGLINWILEAFYYFIVSILEVSFITFIGLGFYAEIAAGSLNS
jgi:hypothetical protein